MNLVAEAHVDAAVADLRRRLAEAEETLRAIRDGEVDALVMRGEGTDEVFTIEGDTESYRSFMESMEPGAAALDPAGRVLYVNSTLRGLLDKTLEQVQGRPVAEAIGGTAGEDVAALLRDAGSERQSREVRFCGYAEGDRHFIASVTPLRLGTVTGHALTLADVTERVRAEAAEQSERAARAVIASANEAVLVCDRDGVVTHANAAASILYAGDPVGHRFGEVIPLVFPSAGLMSAEDVISMAVGGNPIQGIEVVAPQAPKVRDYLISAAPLQVAGDQVSGCVITMVDLSQRKAAEKQQLLLMGELDHRVKNTLALVLSIASRTLSHEDTLEGFQKAFTGRIQALAATHTLLADKSWTNLMLRDVIMAELAPYVGGSGGRVVTEGLEVAVAPRAAIALGLVVHELTTNAVKYGALSRNGGRVTVRAIGHTPEAGSLVIEWRESGGPEVAPPTRKGFGGTVIARSLQYSVNGGAEIDYDRAGLVCRIMLPSEDLP